MSRPKSSIFAFSVFSFALLLMIGLAAPNLAFAQDTGQLGANPPALSFGNVTVGTTSPSQTDTVTNQFDDDNVVFSSVSGTPGFVETSNTCGSPLAPLQTCQIDVACKPTKTGLLSGSLVFVYTSKETSGKKDKDDGHAHLIVPLTCTGISGATPTPTTSWTSRAFLAHTTFFTPWFLFRISCISSICPPAGRLST